MTQNDYLEWIINWFNKTVNVSKAEVSHNFFKERWLDSFNTLLLISDIESTFNICFDDSTFNNEKFYTMLGLSEIIFEFTNNREAI